MFFKSIDKKLFEQITDLLSDWDSHLMENEIKEDDSYWTYDYSIGKWYKSDWYFPICDNGKMELINEVLIVADNEDGYCCGLKSWLKSWLSEESISSEEKNRMEKIYNKIYEILK